MAEAGLADAHGYLSSVDPVSAARINPNDGYRISRAIEVFRQTGKPLSSFSVPDSPRGDMKVLVIGLTRNKTELDERIRRRVDMMFDDGVVDEIGKLLEMGANSKWQSMQGIGYSEFIRAVEAYGGLDSVNLDNVREQIVMDSIHYAKRQMTFFRSFNDVNWVNPDDTQKIRDLLERNLQNYEAN
ncbi:MAG: hypothetical protein MJ052_03960 [Sphaerochaetaceae bacterium]|nr:hypothetical protein [Sphaerochaetaceae bacterium]